MTRTVFHGGKVFDGTGADPVTADVAIEGNRIIEVGTGLDGDDGVDVTGKTILPGLFDCHVHVTTPGPDMLTRLQRPFSYEFYLAAKHLSATLDRGITTVRDAGGADLGIKRAVADGLIDGPRMMIAVTILSQTGGHADGMLPSGISAPLSLPHPGRPDGVVDGPETVRRKVREVIRAGADVIKVCTSGGVLSPEDDPRHAQFSVAEVEVMVAEAAAVGIPVMAHAQATDGIKNAIRAGVRSIEHGIYLDDEAIGMMLDAGTFLVPTLTAPQAVIDAAEAGAQLPESVVRKAKEVRQIHHESFSAAVAAGVNIAMGTDSGVGPHGNNLAELPLMRDGGMTPSQVLRATTASAAELLGLSEELGTVTPGKRADLVIVDGDPYDLASLPDHIASVYTDGRRAR